MERDWDVIRTVLEEIEALPPEKVQSTKYMPSGETRPEEVTKIRHVLLLHDAGYVEGIVHNATAVGRGVLAPELTWQGHELLALIRSKPLWNRVKVLAGQKGLELTFDSIKALAKIAFEQIAGG